MTTTTTPPKFEITLTEEITGTYLHGYITANYKDIVKLLGRPDMGADGYKVDAEWAIKINGKVLTIYNYKDGKNYLGSKGLPKTKITEWHIGANTEIKEEADFLASQLNSSFRPTY